MTDLGIQLAAVQEKLVSLNDKATAAHARVDKLEETTREDLRDLKSSLEKLNTALTDLNLIIARWRGAIAAYCGIGTIIGTLLGTLVSFLLKK